MSEASFAEQLKKRRIGAQGYKQRQSAESATEPAQAAFSHLARHLLEEYSWGGFLRIRSNRFLIWQGLMGFTIVTQTSLPVSAHMGGTPIT